MVRKETEGGNLQRRQKAREARERGKLPSEMGVTTGGSKQRHHLRNQEEHADKFDAIHMGKQKVIKGRTPTLKPRSRPPGGPGARP